MRIRQIKNPDAEYYSRQIGELATVAKRDSILLSTALEVRRNEQVFKYLLVGTPAEKGSEIHAIQDISGKDVFIDTKLANDHLQATPLYFTDYKFVNIYVSTDNGTTSNLLKTILIDWEYPFTEFKDDASYPVEPIYDYSFNGNNNPTPKERVRDTDRGFLVSYRKGIQGRDLRASFNKATFGDPYSEVLDGSVIYMLLNSAYSDYARIINDIDRDYFGSSYIFNTYKDVTFYTLPFATHFPTEVRVNGCTVSQMSRRQIPQDRGAKCDETCPVEETTSCCPAEEAEEEPETCEPCQQILGWYLLNDMIGFYPVPSQEHTIQVLYAGMPNAISENEDVDFPLGFDKSLIIAAQYYYFSMFKHDAENLNETNKYAALVKQEEERIKQYVRGRFIARRAQEDYIIHGKQAHPFAKMTSSGLGRYPISRIY